MLMKTERSTPIGAVEINVREDVGISDVWLHKNIEESTRINDQGEASIVYTADEVYFMHANSDVLAQELTDNFDNWFEFGISWQDGTPPISLEERVSAVEDAVAELIGEVLNNG